MVTETSTFGPTAERPFHTSQLGSLRQFIDQHPTLREMLGPIAKFKLVIDANVVIGDLRFRLKNPNSGATAVEELIRSTVFEVWAPRWLEVEIGKHLPLLAGKENLPIEALTAEWIRYRALLKWDDLEPPPPTTASPGCADPKDLPYVRLAERIRACGILSKDPHIDALGGHRLNLDFVLCTRSYARSATVTVSLRALGVTLGGASLAAVSEIYRAAVRQVQELPEPVKLLLIAGLVTVLAQPDARRWLTDRFNTAQTQLRPASLILLNVIGEFTRLAEVNRTQAATHLSTAMSMLPPPLVRRRKRLPASALKATRRHRRGMSGVCHPV